MIIFHKPCRSWVSGLRSLHYRQNVSCELGHCTYTLSDSTVLRSMWAIPLDFCAAMASCSCSEALETDLETTFGPQPCRSPAGVIPFKQWEYLGSWTVSPFTLGLPSLYRTISGKQNKSREEMELLILTAAIFLDHYAYDLLSSSIQYLWGLWMYV